MSVQKEARGKRKFKVLIDARSLAKYTLHILKNNKHFKSMPTGDAEDDLVNPPQPELVGEMRNTVIAIFISAYSANETPFTKQNYRHRRQLQDKAISKCNELLALVEMSIPIFHIPLNRVENWSSQIVCVRSQLQSWKESDYTRYRKM